MIFVKECQPCLPPPWPTTLQALFKPLLFVLSAQSWLMESTQHSNLNPILDAPQPEPYIRCTPTDRHFVWLFVLLSSPWIVSNGPNQSHLSSATSLPWAGHQNKARHDLPLARGLTVQPAKGGEKAGIWLSASEIRGSFCLPLWFTRWWSLTQEKKKELRGRAVKKKKKTNVHSEVI